MQGTQINPKSWREPEPATQSLRPPVDPTSSHSGIWERVTRSLRFHWVAAVVVSVVLLVIAVAFQIRYKPSYVATSLIYVSPNSPMTLKNGDPETSYPYDSYVQQQLHSITQYDVLAHAIHSLPAGVWQLPGESEPATVARLEHSLTVARVDSSYQISISLSGKRPEHLAEIVNAVTQSYLAKAKQEEFYGRDERLATLRAARADLEKDLDSTLAEQADISRKLGVAQLGGHDLSDPYDDQLNRVRADLATAHQQRIEAETKLQALKAGSQSSGAALDTESAAAVANDPQLTAVKESLGKQRSMLMSQAAGLTENNPLRKQSEADIAQIDKGLKDVEQNLRRNASKELEDRTHSNVLRTEMVEAQLQQELQQDAAAANSAAPRFQRADELKAQIDRLQARYTQVDDRIQELDLQSNSPGVAHLFAAAMTPFAPEPNKLGPFAPFLLPIVLLAGVLAAIAMDYFDPHVYTREDLEKVLGFSPIGSLFADEEVTQLVFDEGVLRLAAAVDHATRTAGTRTFVLTATDKDGQTGPLLENLAHSLAGLGRKVITIDASGYENPIAYTNAEMEDVGLASRNLAGSLMQDSLMRSSSQTPVVSAQPLTSRVAPLTNFVSEAFQELTNDYEIVLINAAPLLCSAETEYLARCADVTVLVATASKTRKNRLLHAARVLERIDVPGVASIITEVSLRRANSSVKNEVREFEARMNSANLRWKPKFTPFVVGGGYRKENVEQEVSSAEETVAGLG